MPVWARSFVWWMIRVDVPGYYEQLREVCKLVVAVLQTCAKVRAMVIDVRMV